MLEQVVHCLGKIVATRQLRALLPQPAFEIGDQRHAQLLPDRPAPLGAFAVDRALDLEQSVDAPDRLQRQRRDHAGRLALCPPASILREIGEGEERAAGMGPAAGLVDPVRLAVGLVELVVAAEGVGLENASPTGKMRLRVLAAPIVRVIEHRRRRIPPAEGPVGADIDPTSPGVGLSLGQDRDGGVIAVQSLGCEDMRLDAREERGEDGTAGADLIGQGREAERHPFPGVAFSLAVERLVLPKLLEQDHRQEARTGPTTGDHMERRRRLADLLAVPAGKLLPDMLDHLPPPRNRLQRLGDVLAHFAQARPAAALAGRRRRLDHALAWQMLGKGLARRAPAGKAHYVRRLGHGALGGDLVLTGRALELLEPEFHLIEKSRRAFRTLAIKLAPQLLDLQTLVGDQRIILGGLGLCHRQLRRDARRPRRRLMVFAALGNQRRSQRFNIVRQMLGRGFHARHGITIRGR